MEINFSDIYILIAGLSLFGLEILLFKIKGKNTISIEQSILNLGLGMIERLIGIITINFGIYFFTSLIPWRIFHPIENHWLAFTITFFVVDFMWYVYHRISHRISLIWAAHLIHHQSVEYNFSVNFAISPFGFFVRIFVYSSLVLFGLTPEDIILVNAINAFYQYLLHSELWPKFNGWEKIFVTPKFHQIHHSSVHEHLDTNYGGMFTIWDQIFGTFNMDNKKIRYGLNKQIEQKDPFHLQILFFLRLIQNFREYSFKRAFLLLFLGPEAQSAEIPNLYKTPIHHHRNSIVFGFLIFLVGYTTLAIKLLPTWISFTLGILGIVICSGIVHLIPFSKKLKKLS
jgi:alkylglycerol monooxygenase